MSQTSPLFSVVKVNRLMWSGLWCFHRSRSGVRIELAVVMHLVMAGMLSANDEPIDFNRQILPLLSANCFACHGPDEDAREGDLRLDVASGAGAAIVPGDPQQSVLIQRVESDDENEVMPPPESGHQLSPEQKVLLRRWVESGGAFETHWALVKPIRDTSSVPANVHPIDHFVIRRLAGAGLSLAPPADRYQWLRRVSLDLIGLPPTAEHVKAFVHDTSADAQAKVVDRLLADDAFGEHWARLWLDLARYADTKGYEKDNPREIWRYRDWVIDALNRDLPYDDFTIAQLAGDLLPNATTEQKLATAFHRNTLTNEEGGTDDEEFRLAAVKDRVDTTMQVWMGLTMGCAKCHSHKYDPITQHDYYRFLAFFNQTADEDREAPFLSTPTAEQLAGVQSLGLEIADLQERLGKAKTRHFKDLKKWQQQRSSDPDWQTLTLTDFQSQHDLRLQQNQDGKLVVDGKLPDKDHWQATVELTTETRVRALRVETFPKLADEGNANDKNFVLNELSVQVIDGNAAPREVTLRNARADFSQQGWDVAGSIDDDPKSGWAVSPQADKPHVAIWELTEPLELAKGSRLRLSMAQTYGGQLILSRFRVAASNRDPSQLKPTLGSDSPELFWSEFGATKQLWAELKSARERRDSLRRSFPNTPVMKELPEEKARTTRIHLRGNFLDQGEEVRPAVPTAFHPFPSEMPANRLGVARWLVDAENPLTARVMANRVWARLFGIGIVETEEDFGTQGLRPSHPQLLDWLAIEYQSEGWSLKKLLRFIVLSRTYQQSSLVDPAKLVQDPRNRLLSRGPRFRMSAEMIRDQALAASGLLAKKLGGPSVMPPQPNGVWKSTYSNRKWVNAEGENRYRRGLYTYWKRTSPYPAMTTFDAGSGEVCLIRRVRTNTPLQALITLNDPAYLEAAGGLARRLERQGIDAGFAALLTRPPTEQEKRRIETLREEVEDDFDHDLAAATNLVESAGLGRLNATARLASWVTVANVLLNLDETVTKP